MAERRTLNPQVLGSSPRGGTTGTSPWLSEVPKPSTNPQRSDHPCHFVVACCSQLLPCYPPKDCGGMMPLLTAAKVKTAGPRKHQDGQGLYLRVYESGSRCWVLRLTVDGRRRENNLGGWPNVSLADARKKALEHRAAVAVGRDPLSEKRRADVPTFREAAKPVYDANRPRWKSEAHAARWWPKDARTSLPRTWLKKPARTSSHWASLSPPIVERLVWGSEAGSREGSVQPANPLCHHVATSPASRSA